MSESNKWNLSDIFFSFIFFVLGALNIIFIHIVPGLLYATIALIYFPNYDILLKQQLGITFPRSAKIIFGAIVIWGTLAVGDLMELFESCLLK